MTAKQELDHFDKWSEEQIFVQTTFFAQAQLSLIDRFEHATASNAENTMSNISEQVTLCGIYNLCLHLLVHGGQINQKNEPDVTWQAVLKNFESAIKERDLVCIKHKLDLKKYQSVFRSIFNRIIRVLDRTKEVSIFKAI